MGAGQGKALSPPWRPLQGGFYSPKLELKLKSLSQNPHTFLQFHPDCDRMDFDPYENQSLLENAIKSDEKIAQWLPRLVPKRVSEEEFWRNYFSHINALTINQPVFETLEQAEAFVESDTDEAEIVIPSSPNPKELEIAEEQQEVYVKQQSEIKSIQEISESLTEERTKLLNFSEKELKRKVVRWGIIGGGDVIARKSGPAIIGVSGSKLTAVMCRSEVNAKEVTKKLGAVNYYTNAEDLVRDPEVDIVYIATPPGAHMEYALLVAKYKKACLLEKPFARSAYECREIIDAFGRSGSSLFVAYYRRAHDRWRLAQKLVQNHLGTVTSISLKLHRSDHLLDVLDEGKDARNFGWRVNAEQAGGGLFMDLGCHMLDILDFLVGPIENVQGDAVRLFSPKYDVENVVSMTFRTKAGALGTASWNFVSSSFEDKLEIVGTNATLRMSFFGKDFPVISYSDSDSVEVPPDSPVPEFVHQGLIQEIVNELRGANGWKCQSNGVSALRTAKVMDSVLRRFYRSRDDDFWKRPNTWLN